MIDFTLSDVLPLAISFVLGAIIGVLYFWALWLSSRHLIDNRHPKTSLVVGLLVRVSVLLVGFVFILDVRHWEQLSIALLGFVVVRTITIRLVAINTVAPQKKIQSSSVDSSSSMDSSATSSTEEDRVSP